MSELIGRDKIQTMIPHSGDMCLLHEIRDWDLESLLAIADTPCAGNPLLCDGALPAESCIEYGAQAAALHAVLSGADLTADKPAFLAAVKNLEIFSSAQVENISILRVEVRIDAKSPMGASYHFRCSVDDALWVSGSLSLLRMQK